MRKITKFAVSCFAFLAVFVAVMIPVHEFEHCLFYWARGNIKPCNVVFEPLGMTDKDGSFAYTMSDDTYWYEHPIIWSSAFAVLIYLFVRLGRWVIGHDHRSSATRFSRVR